MLLDAGLMWLGSGLTDPDVSLAATLALYCSFGQARPCALNGPQFLAALGASTRRSCRRTARSRRPPGRGWA